MWDPNLNLLFFVSESFFSDGFCRGEWNERCSTWMQSQTTRWSIYIVNLTREMSFIFDITPIAEIYWSVFYFFVTVALDKWFHLSFPERRRRSDIPRWSSLCLATCTEWTGRGNTWAVDWRGPVLVMRSWAASVIKKILKPNFFYLILKTIPYLNLI